MTKPWTRTEKGWVLWGARQRKVLTEFPECPQGDGEDEVTLGNDYLFHRCLVVLAVTFRLKLKHLILEMGILLS